MKQGSPQRSRLRRRLRLAQRYISYATNSDFYPTCLPAKVFWVDARPNFGDDMVPGILARQGIAAESCDPVEAELAAIGSILEMLPRSFSGYVWGSGQMMDHAMVPFAGSPTFLAVRGRLTRGHLGLDESVALGDPGLLVDNKEFHVQARSRRGVAVVPHYHHIGSHWHKRLLSEGRNNNLTHWVDVRKSPSYVIRRIAQSEAVVTTSLHGLIVADAVQVPAVWGTPAPDIGGGDFKFRDYESAFELDGMRKAPVDTLSLEELLDVAHPVDRDRLEFIQCGLRDAIRPFTEARASSMCSPMVLPMKRLGSKIY